MKLAGKTAFITGAARRIGREIALTLAGRGASIVIHYHHSRPEALKLQKEIRALGAEAFLADEDLGPAKGSFEKKIRRFVAKIYQAVKTVDVLVNNAAVFYPTPFGKISEGDWEAFMTPNLKAPFFLSQEIGMRMLKQKSGKIINLLDGKAFRPAERYLPYAISKAGLVAATAGLAKVLAPHVQVLGIAPGPILPAKGMSAGEKRRVVQKTLLKRFGHPRDIAQTVRFFIEDTDYITGTVLAVDGGASIVSA